MTIFSLHLVNQLRGSRGSVFGTRDCCLPRLRRERAPMSTSKVIGCNPCKVHQSLRQSPSSGSRLIADCKFISTSKPRCRRFDGLSVKLLCHSTVSPSPDRSCDSTFTGGLSLCALSEITTRGKSRAFASSLDDPRKIIALPSNLDSNSHSSLPIFPKGNQCASQNTRKKDSGPTLAQPCKSFEAQLTANQTVPSHSDVQNMCWNSHSNTANTAE